MKVWKWAVAENALEIHVITELWEILLKHFIFSE